MKTETSDKLKNPFCETCRVRHKSIFSSLENGQLNSISTNKTCNLYRKGDTIFHEGNYPYGLFSIYTGRIKVYKTTESGKDHILRLAQAGDSLGYRSLISGEKYEVSATALEDSRICFIPKEQFIDSLKGSHNLTERVMQLLTDDLKMAETKITDLAQKSVKERTAETLLMLRQFYGLDSDGKTIKVNLSREDLANLVGTATETLIRMLSDFKQKEIIDLKGKKIIILNFPVLERLANNFD